MKKRKRVETFQMNMNPYSAHLLFTPKERIKAVTALQKHIKEHDAYELENMIYIKASRDVIVYKRELARMVFNLSQNKDLLCRTYSISEIFSLSDSFLGKGTRAEERDLEAHQKLVSVQKYILDLEGDQERAQQIKSIGGRAAAVCPKCHKDDQINYESAQTRSIDEGMTQKAFCRRCNKKFLPHM